MRTGRYESSENSNIGTAITFLLIGLGAGALTGLLLAPKAGKQLRRDRQSLVGSVDRIRHHDLPLDVLESGAPILGEPR